MMWSTGSKKIRIKNIHSITLIELLVVIVIIGIIVALNLPKFKGSMDNLKFDDFSKNLFFRMKYLKERSAAEGNIYRLSFDMDNKVIQIESEEEGSIEFKPARGILGRSINIPDKIKVDVKEPLMTFYPDSTIEGSDIVISGYGNRASIIIKQTIGSLELVK